jgi:hypothetical protein
MSERKDNKKMPLDESVIFGAGQYGASLLAPTDAERDAINDGMKLFWEAVERHENVSEEFKHGNFFEYIEAAKFNAEAARKGSPLYAHVTAAEGDPHAAADIIISRDDDLVKEVQAKSSDDPARLSHSLSDPKYHGMDKLVPKGQEDRVAALADHDAHHHNAHAADYADTSDHVTGELHAGHIASGGTSYRELRVFTENPGQYIELHGAMSLPEEVLDLGFHAAEAGFIVGGAIHLTKNGIGLLKGAITPTEAAQNTLRYAAESGGRSVFVGGLGSIFRNIGHAVGSEALSKSNVATSLAAGLIRTVKTVRCWACGDITDEQAMEEIGQTGCATLSGLYAGAVGAIFFPPAGAILGSMGGYIVAIQIYQSCIAILKRSRLAEQESRRIVSLREESCRIMTQQRIDFEQRLENKLEIKRKEFAGYFALIDQGLYANRPEIAVMGLNAFACLFGKKLMTLDEFNDFMSHSTNPLII